MSRKTLLTGCVFAFGLIGFCIIAFVFGLLTPLTSLHGPQTYRVIPTRAEKTRVSSGQSDQIIKAVKSNPLTRKGAYVSPSCRLYELRNAGYEITVISGDRQ